MATGPQKRSVAPASGSQLGDGGEGEPEALHASPTFLGAGKLLGPGWEAFLDTLTPSAWHSHFSQPPIGMFLAVLAGSLGVFWVVSLVAKTLNAETVVHSAVASSSSPQHRAC